MSQPASSSSGRILLDVPCKVCRDHSSGKHYGIYACDGCAGFFKRSIRRSRRYSCKTGEDGPCPVDKVNRNQCRACRFQKCCEAGMNADAVQHERGPRNATIRRRALMYLKENGDAAAAIAGSAFRPSPSYVGCLSTTTATSGEAPPKSAADVTAAGVAARLAEVFETYARTVASASGAHPFRARSQYFLDSREALCEAAARLLFANILWIKSLPSFASLSLADRNLLLQESWEEMFVLGACQYQLPVGWLSPLRGRALSDAVGSETESAVAAAIESEVRVLGELVARFVAMGVDAAEYSCLRAVILFRTVFENGTASSRGRLQHPRAVTALQDQAQSALCDYDRAAHPAQPLRFGRLLLALPALRTVSPGAIEELFFRRTIGNAPMGRLLLDLYESCPD